MMFLKCIHIHKVGPYNRQGQCCMSECLCLTVCTYFVQMVSVCDAFRVQIELEPLQFSSDTVMEGGICTWIVCVCLSPAFSGSAIQWYIHRVDSSRLKVSLDITHKAPAERKRGRVGGVEDGVVDMCVYVRVARKQKNSNRMEYFLLLLPVYSQPLTKCCCVFHWFSNLELQAPKGPRPRS